MFFLILVGVLRRNKASTIINKIYESVKDEKNSGIKNDMENFLKKSDKLKNFKFL